ncbi:hypothetical protein evm_003707 [Chilo suppressalis]|nr:hypothetical protein evm_003707 [Chilo suppressalis]
MNRYTGDIYGESSKHVMAASNQGFLSRRPGFATLAIRAGQEPEKWKSAAVTPPIFTSTTYEKPSPSEDNDITKRFVYRTIKRYNEDSSVDDRSRSGRPRSVDDLRSQVGAYEQTAHLMVSDHRRPWTLATPGVSQMRCRPLRKEYALFLKVFGSYRSGNTAGDNILHSFVVHGKKFRQKRTVVDSHASR